MLAVRGGLDVQLLCNGIYCYSNYSKHSVVGSWQATNTVMRFRTLSRRLAAIVGVAGGGSLLAVIAFSKQQSHRNVRSTSWLLPVRSDYPLLLRWEKRKKQGRKRGLLSHVAWADTGVFSFSTP